MSYQGMPCWFELATPDLAAAARFYGAVLGWTMVDSGMPGMTYHLAKMGANGVAGMMPAAAGQPAVWSTYFAVDDLKACLAQATGCTVIVPATDIPGTGSFAMLIDAQGAAFGLLQPLPMDAPQVGAFDQSLPGHGNWIELITPDPASALAFYGGLLGWTRSQDVPMGPDMTYHLFARNGADIGGTCALPGTPPHWKPYFAVPSIHAAARAVTAAGGTVVHGPDQVPGGAFTLQIADPNGIRLALVGPA